MVTLLIFMRSIFLPSLTRGDLDTYVVVFVGVFLTRGDARRGVNVICAREVNC
jgi:hypothetical protein